MKIKNVLLVWLFGCCALPVYADSKPWLGSYFYEASLGQNVGGDAVIKNYTLVVDAGKCEISIEGYQVAEVLICKATATGNNLAVTFQSFEDGTVENIYGVSVYPVDSLLLQLTQGKALTTTWGQLLPHESLAKTGKYFKRLK